MAEERRYIFRSRPSYYIIQAFKSRIRLDGYNELSASPDYLCSLQSKPWGLKFTHDGEISSDAIFKKIVHETIDKFPNGNNTITCVLLNEKGKTATASISFLPDGSLQYKTPYPYFTSHGTLLNAARITTIEAKVTRDEKSAGKSALLLEEYVKFMEQIDTENSRYSMTNFAIGINTTPKNKVDVVLVYDGDNETGRLYTLNVSFLWRGYRSKRQTQAGREQIMSFVLAPFCTIREVGRAKSSIEDLVEEINEVIVPKS